MRLHFHYFTYSTFVINVVSFVFKSERCTRSEILESDMSRLYLLYYKSFARCVLF